MRSSWGRSSGVKFVAKRVLFSVLGPRDMGGPPDFPTRPLTRRRVSPELAHPPDEAVRDHARNLRFAANRVDRTTVRVNRTPLVQGDREEGP